MAAFGSRRGDLALLAALAAGDTVAESARKAGISERTAERRLADDGFRRQLSALRGDMLDRAVGRLAEAATAAADTLVELAEDGSPTVRLSAARSILEFGPKLRDQAELEARIARLEEQLEAAAAAEQRGEMG